MSWTRKLLPRSPKTGLSLPPFPAWTRRLLPRSLRSRLIVSFALLIFVALFIAASGTIVLLRQQQERAARERVGLLALPIAQDAAVLEALGRPPIEIEAALEQEYNVRILLLDRNARVVSDTGDSLTGAVLEEFSSGGDPPFPPGPASTSRAPQGERFRVQKVRQDGDDFLMFLAPPVGFRVFGIGTYYPDLQAVVAVQESDVSQAWRDLLPRLFMAGGVAFLGSVIAASILARSISRPLRQITLASEEMARGRFDQQIPSYGGDEVGRLARAFNQMSRQVSLSHRTLRDFLANVSHELKTPLTSIQGFSQAMVDGALSQPADFAEAGKIINDEAVRMRGLVDDLLYLSQVESGEVVMHFEPLSPSALLAETQERFARRASQGGVRLELRTVATPQIRADGRRLEQAVANITENAVRHTPRGGRVTLSSNAADGHVSLSVHNTGSVIPPEALPRIFDRFFQADPASARAEGNTGLGLAITREIVEAHGGSIEVTSSAETGTRFVITLPIQPPAGHDDAG